MLSFKKLFTITGGTALAIVLFIAAKVYAFQQQVDGEIFKQAQIGVQSSPRRFTYAELAGLPEPVQRYLKYALKDGQPIIRFANLEQRGFFRLGPGEDLKPITADQYFITTQPGFVWRARLQLGPGLWIAARDRYAQGRGNMLVKLLSTITLADARGREMDVSSLIRYFSEAPWFPTAFLPGDYLEWEAIDSTSARAIMRDQDLEASAVFYFNEIGQITHLVSEDRYRTVGNEYQKEKWTAYYREYRQINNIFIPTEGEVVWNLPSGDYSYAKLIVTDIQYKMPMLSLI